MINNLGVDPDEWFDNPLDRMPLATDGGGTNKYHPDGEPPDWEDTAPSEYEPPDDWFEEKKPEPKKEEEKTMHQKMYEIATSRYNPFSLGGSENCDSDVSCNNLGGGSEKYQSTE